jgi:hypothetical protein
MRWLKKGDSGQALIMSLIVLALGSLLVIPLLEHTISNLKYNQSIECETLTAYSADAGIEYATCKIYQNPGAYITTPLQERFTVNGRTVNVAATYEGSGMYVVTSTASGGGCGKTTIRSMVNLSVGSFAYSIASKTGITLSNTISDSTPEHGNAHIYSNANISITGTSSRINGDAYCVGTVTKGSAQIAGQIYPGADPLTFPTVNAALYEQMAKEGGTIPGDLVYSTAGTYSLGPKYITGKLELKPNVKLILTGPLYVKGPIVVGNGRFIGQEHLLSESYIKITGGGYESEAIPVVTSINSYITLVGPVVAAVLYAPVGTVTITNCQVYGAVGGNSINFSNVILNYNEQLQGRQDLPGSELFPLTYSYE